MYGRCRSRPFIETPQSRDSICLKETTMADSSFPVLLKMCRLGQCTVYVKFRLALVDFWSFGKSS